MGNGRIREGEIKRERSHECRERQGRGGGRRRKRRKGELKVSGLYREGQPRARMESSGLGAGAYAR